MKMKKILSLLISLAMMMSGAVVSYAEDAIAKETVAKIGETGYASFAEAMAAANDMTAEEVTVELYDKVEYSDSTENLIGSYKTINFVGKTENAEISITRNGQGGYISGNANGTPNVTFTDLILSKPEGGYVNDAGFMNQYFTVYRAGELTYTNCVFPDGACAQNAKAVYNNCEFANKTSGEYSLWVYANADVTVNGGKFTGIRGAKMYMEPNGIAGDLTLKGVEFTESVTQKPAIVLTYGASVTLENNTYPAKGVFELDKDGAPNGTTVTADITDIACISDDYADCGVLMGGKIYTTVNDALAASKEGDTIVLMYDTEEAVEMPSGVLIDKNGHTADNIKPAGPMGNNSFAYTKEVDGYVRVWGEGWANAQESYVLKLYSNEKLIATTSLNNIGGIIDGDVTVTWNFIYPESNDEYWTTTWEENQPNSKDIPTHVVLFTDGEEVAKTVAKMSGADDVNPVKWRKLGGVKIADLEGEGTSESPYLISSLEELKWFRDDVNAGNNYSKKYVQLTESIDLAEDKDAEGNQISWTPIGTDAAPFNGIFDGNEKTVQNLVITGYNIGVGFFGRTNNGEVKNLTINNANVSGRLSVGTVAGTPYTSKYTNINLTGHVEVNGMAYVGGVGGRNAYADWTNITVNVDESSYVNANSVENGIAYRTYVGGVIGFIGEGGHKFTNIKSNIKVSGSTCDVGGITGIAHYGNTFSKVECSGSVEITDADELSSAKEIGGIAGVWHNQVGTKVTFEECSFTGELSSTYVNEEGEKVTLTTNDFANAGLIGAPYSEPTEDSGEMVIDYAAYIGRTLYKTLKEALANSAAGDTVTLLSDASDIGKLTVKSGVTLDGAGYTISGNSAFINELYKEGTIVIENCNFKEITNGEGTLSPIYVERYSQGAEIIIRNNTFDGNDWDSLAITLHGYGDVAANEIENPAKIIVTGNTFKDSDETTSTKRYIHIQPIYSGETSLPINFTVTGNKIYDDSVETAVGIWYVEGELDLSGNYVENMDKIAVKEVVDGEYVNGLERMLPFKTEDLSEDIKYAAMVKKDVDTVNLYTSLEDALKSLEENSTLTLLNDVTIDYAWDTRKTGATITVPVTINGNGKTIKFTNTVFDGYNHLAAFRIENDTKIQNLTIDMSEAKSGWGTRIRAISFKGRTLFISDCNFIGNPELTSSRAIIYGEGADENKVGNVQLTVTHSTFKDWKRGVTDNENGDNVWSVNINGSKFENADVAISASSEIKFRGNTMIDSYANLTSYAEASKLKVIATGNTLSENTATDMNTVGNAATVETQDGFLLPVAEIGSKEYFNLETALARANAGETVKLIDNITLSAPVTVPDETNAVLDLNGYTVSYTNDILGEYMIINNGILTIDDSTEAKEGKIIYTYTGEGDPTYGKGNWTIDNRKELVVNNGTIENTTADVPLASYAINNNSAGAASAKLTVNGGKILNTNNVAIRQFIGGKNEVIVNGGDIEGIRAIWLQLAGSDGTKAPEVTLDINGGTLTANGGEEGYLLAIYSYTYGASRNNVNIDISGGIFNGDVALGGGNKATYENALVTGGTFNGDVYTYHTEAPGFITGGTFKSDVTEYCANGFKAELNEDGTYGIKEIPSNTPVVTVGTDSITVSAYIKNTTEKESPVRLLVATYDAQGKLLNVGSETTDSIDAGVQMREETMTVVSKSGADTYRVFIWADGMLPLIKTTRVAVE